MGKFIGEPGRVANERMSDDARAALRKTVLSLISAKCISPVLTYLEAAGTRSPGVSPGVIRCLI